MSIITALIDKFFRFLHEQSEMNYFVLGTNPVGKACETTALLVPSDDAAFKILVDLLKVEVSSPIRLSNLSLCILHFIRKDIILKFN